MSRRVFVPLLLCSFAVLACSDSTRSGASGVAVRFTTSAPSSALGANASIQTAGAADALVVTGTNGTLTITDIAMIVSRVEFERKDEACETIAGASDGGDHDDKGKKDDRHDDDDDECAEFKENPAFIHMPLPGGAVTVATDQVPVGTWTDLKFRVKNVDLDDDDDDDDDDANAMTDLTSKIRGEFPDWPRKAVMVVKGSFKGAAATDTARAFTSFFDGQIKIRLDIEPPLEITATGANRTLTVELDPSRWFMIGERVRDLSLSDFRRTHLTVRFDTELQHGFIRVRTDRSH